ncbi:GYD domain-containing protein [Variovorax sp. KK3]|uniref:GYD domain-containing protein n=2 Tax=Variovorax sp. KK3 TaxID=1855728 RepID=UPI0027424AB0|nr:GYD domain-containing protein [Variovorax sp. KK3]
MVVVVVTLGMHSPFNKLTYSILGVSEDGSIPLLCTPGPPVTLAIAKEARSIPAAFPAFPSEVLCRPAQVSFQTKTAPPLRRPADHFTAPCARTASGGCVGSSSMASAAYDLVAVMEAEDEQALAAFSLTTAMQGNVRVQSLRAFTSGEMDAVLAKLP